MLDGLWRAYDVAYRWFHGVEDLPADDGAVVRIGVERYRGPRVALADGTVVLRGDLVGIIHFNNELIQTFHNGAPDPARIGILMRRAFERSLETLARLGETHPRYQAIKAFRATTILHQGAERAGFEIFPLSSRLLGRIVAAYGRSMLARFHPLGALRARRKRFAEARVLWISRAELRRRYARVKSSPSETSS